MPDRIDLRRLRSLRQEKPDTVMGLVRLAWPEISKALEGGHSLKTVHARVVETGINIGYRRLSEYIGRIRKRQSGKPLPQAPRDLGPKVESVVQIKRDPLANVRERLQKRPGFQFDDTPANLDDFV